MADMRKWEDLTPAERSARLSKYNSEVKAENASRRANAAAAPKKQKASGANYTRKAHTSLFDVAVDVQGRKRAVNRAVDDAS